MTSVVCTKCLTEKASEEFGRHSGRPNGLQAHCRECRRAYRAANRERLAEKGRKYREDNPEQVAAHKRAWYLRNTDLAKERAAGHRLIDPARTRQKARKSLYLRRTQRFGTTPVVEDFTEADVIDRYGDSCFYCEDGAFEELDHVIPVRRGGPHTLDNVRPSCVKCNRGKGDRAYEREIERNYP